MEELLDEYHKMISALRDLNGGRLKTFDTWAVEKLVEKLRLVDVGGWLDGFLGVFWDVFFLMLFHVAKMIVY